MEKTSRASHVAPFFILHPNLDVALQLQRQEPPSGAWKLRKISEKLQNDKRSLLPSNITKESPHTAAIVPKDPTS